VYFDFLIAWRSSDTGTSACSCTAGLPRIPALDPSAVFKGPEEVRDNPELSTAQKIEILKSWAYDGAEMSVAVEEGMPEAPIDDMERRVLVVLEELTGDIDLEHTGPSKHHGIPSGAKGQK
jgi:hypothetical protein